MLYYISYNISSCIVIIIINHPTSDLVILHSFICIVVILQYFFVFCIFIQYVFLDWSYYIIILLCIVASLHSLIFIATILQFFDLYCRVQKINYQYCSYYTIFLHTCIVANVSISTYIVAIIKFSYLYPNVIRYVFLYFSYHTIFLLLKYQVRSSVVLQRRVQWGGGRLLQLGLFRGPSAAAITGLGTKRCSQDRLEKLPLGILYIWEVNFHFFFFITICLNICSSVCHTVRVYVFLTL